MTATEMQSARAIRATLHANGSLRDPAEFRAQCRASRALHGDERHEAVKAAALHMSADR